MALHRNAIIVFGCLVILIIAIVLKTETRMEKPDLEQRGNNMRPGKYLTDDNRKLFLLAMIAIAAAMFLTFQYIY